MSPHQQVLAKKSVYAPRPHNVIERHTRFFFLLKILYGSPCRLKADKTDRHWNDQSQENLKAVDMNVKYDEWKPKPDQVISVLAMEATMTYWTKFRTWSVCLG